MGIAFFDLDRTLLAVNSAKLWLRRELKDGNIARLDAMRGAAWVALYHLGYGDVEHVIDRAVATLKDVPESNIRERTLRFYEEEVRPQLRPGALRVLDEHRGSGHRLVLLTSSTRYLSEVVSEELGLDAYLCNSFEVDERGLFTGRALRPLCYGRGKVDHARRLADEHGVPLSACAFYTDSYTDLPMLEVVGEPVAVHPDPRLRREARRRGWRIVDWDA